MEEGDFDDDSFMATYSHATDATNYSEDDERYIKMIFQKFAEQAWDDKGNPIPDKKVLSQKSTKKFAKIILAQWKQLDDEANDSYIEQNFDDTWNKFAKEQVGNLDQ